MIVSQVLDELGISLDHELSEITPGLDKPHVMNAPQPVSEISTVKKRMASYEPSPSSYSRITTKGEEGLVNLSCE